MLNFLELFFAFFKGLHDFGGSFLCFLVDGAAFLLSDTFLDIIVFHYLHFVVVSKLLEDFVVKNMPSPFRLLSALKCFF